MSWLDKSFIKYWAWLFLPGHFIFYWWMIAGYFVASSFSDPSISDDISRQVGLFLSGFCVILSGFWFLIGTYHVMWIDIKKHFIPYKLSMSNGQVTIKGLYLKSDTFKRSDIKSLTTFEVYTHWYKRVHTLFLPNVEHYKLLLTDGRAYHFHGNSTMVKTMLIELSGIENIQVGDE